MLGRQRQMAEQLESATKEKMELQQRYEQLRSTSNRAAVLSAHDEGELSQVQARLQVCAFVVRSMRTHGRRTHAHTCIHTYDSGANSETKPSTFFRRVSRWSVGCL